MEEHERFIELISLKIDGLLDGDGERELAEHIAACPECNELYGIMTRAHGALGFEVEPPAELLTNVMESVRREKAAGSRASRRWVGFAGAFAAAAAALYKVHAGVVGEPVEPHGHPAVASEGAEILIRPQKHVLGHVKGVLLAAGELVCEIIDVTLVFYDQPFKGAGVARRRRSHKPLFLVGDHAPPLLSSF